MGHVGFKDLQSGEGCNSDKKQNKPQDNIYFQSLKSLKSFLNATDVQK